MLSVESYGASVSGCLPCDLSELLDASVSGSGCGCGGRGRVAGRGCGCGRARTSGTPDTKGMSNVAIVAAALAVGAGVWWFMSRNA